MKELGEAIFGLPSSHRRVSDEEGECVGAAHLPSLGVGHLASRPSNGNFLMIGTPLVGSTLTTRYVDWSFFAFAITCMEH
jgi:hypothetical protein